ncbi:hypothetical protein EOPP23_21265 [Endozoicomonas sp. OPT23]|uniref:hypothetical protein n=1 Tax=Endozoicomonas sp. OPT23 TaxID=2072845 RepID=UPI00129BD65E|nr:hypothetical protein [Endozoicomonas sp. OPT23]MRI35493.1 hypothetical protein [Endozoicomonas sp. OPT23]
MLTTLQQFASTSPDWLVLLALVSAIMPLMIMPLFLVGLFGANKQNRTRAYMRFMYLFLPWLPFASLAGLFIMSLSNPLLGSAIAACFIAVRLYFIYVNAERNGLRNSLVTA